MNINADNYKPTLSFKLYEDQQESLDEWLVGQYAQIVAKQKKEIEDPSTRVLALWDLGLPYAGAITDVLTYRFTPTSIGTALVVTNNFNKEEINLSGYENW